MKTYLISFDAHEYWILVRSDRVPTVDAIEEISDRLKDLDTPLDPAGATIDEVDVVDIGPIDGGERVPFLAVKWGETPSDTRKAVFSVSFHEVVPPHEVVDAVLDSVKWSPDYVDAIEEIVLD